MQLPFLQVHCYDKQGYYTGSEVADPSPLEPGEYLVPENSTSEKLPFCPDGHIPFWDGQKWEPRLHPRLGFMARAERNSRLAMTDWCMLPDTPFTEAQMNDIRQYRQALREVPQQPDFPIKVTWPTVPEFLL